MEMLRLHGSLEAALWNVGNQLTLYEVTFGEQAGKLPEIFLALHPVWTEADFEGLLGELRIRGLGHIRSEALRDRLTPEKKNTEMPAKDFGMGDSLSKGSW